MNQRINSTLLLIIGTLEIIGGIGALIIPLIHPSGNFDADHNFQEVGAGLIFMGLVSFWCVKNYRRATIFLYFKLVFFGLFSLLHWLEFGCGRRTIVSPLINTIPFLIIGLMIILTKSAKK